MDQEEEFGPQFKPSADLPKIHKKCNHNRPHTRLKSDSNYSYVCIYIFSHNEVQNPWCTALYFVF